MLSGLTTRGWCLLAAGVAAAVCAAVLNERDLLRVAAFVTALPLLALAINNRKSVTMVAQRRLSDIRIPVGETSAVELELRNKGRLPLGDLLVEDSVPESLGARPRFVVTALTRNTPLRLSYHLKPVSRGKRRIGPLLVKRSDPFGLTESDGTAAGHTAVIVVPQVVPLTGIPGSAGMALDEYGAAALRQGQHEPDASLRPYRDGDDIRKVHWRTSARRDKLVVRTEERSWHGGATVLVDRRAAIHQGSGSTSSFEWAMSCTASICLHLHSQGLSVKLIAENGQLLADGGGRDNHVFLDALAELDPLPRQAIVSSRHKYGMSGSTMLAVLGTIDTAILQELTGFPAGSAVILDVSAWSTSAQAIRPPANESARLLKPSGWNTAIARPGQSVAQVWSELCRHRVTSYPEADRV